MSETLIKVDGVSKKFCRSLKRSLWYGLKDLGSELRGQRHGGRDELRPKEFWAIRDVGFEVKRGECLGLIGYNGAGKSTLLRMLNGLIKPDGGRIEMRGRVGALIALGAGFNPILTGRENLYVNASILGLSKREIDASFDEIVEFAEIGDFIDAPVQSYSSGMKVRLGFSIATMLKPDVLLLDEVLAVGDMRFVLKCFNRIDRILRDTAVIFVSHSMPQVARTATHILVLDKGQGVFQGESVSEGIDRYYSQMNVVPSFSADDRVSLTTASINGRPFTAGSDPIRVGRGEDLTLMFDLEVPHEYESLDISLAFYDKEQRGIAEYFEETGEAVVNRTGSVSVRIEFEKIFFSKGVYSITLGVRDKASRQVLLRAQFAIFFRLLGKGQF